MAIGRYYTIEFYNVEDTFVKVLIGDNSIQTDGTPQIIPMEPTDSPVLISTIDEGENKFTPIKSQQATISFYSSNAVSLQTFSDGPDDRFSVTVLYGTSIVFYGFLSLEDNEEAFLPPRNIVTLTANDKLGALKEIPLTDDSGDNPQGKYTIGNLVAMCLKKTGLSLPLRVINNLRHGTGVLTALTTFDSSPNLLVTAATSFFYPGQRIRVSGTVSNNIEFTVFDAQSAAITLVSSLDPFVDEVEVMATFIDITSQEHFYKSVYLDAKTFEESIGVSEDCYTVLEKILIYDCFITQYKGCWWICRVDEYDNNNFYVSRFDENGEYVDSYIEPSLNKTIGFDEQETVNGEDIDVRYFSEEQTKVLPTRPIGLAKLDFKFEYPTELVCNQDFSRGEFIEDLPDEENEDGILQDVKAYDFQCWDSLSKGAGGVTLLSYDQPPVAGSTLYVKKYFFNDSETFRELFIEAAPGPGAGLSYVKNQALRVQIKDKIQFGVDLKYTNIGSNTGYNNSPVLIGLFADSGNIYFWRAFDEASPNATQVWDQITTSEAVPDWYLGAGVDQEWNLNYTSPPVPETGSVFIYLINQYNDSIRAHYSGLQINVLAFINGSYRVYTGRSHKVFRTDPGYLANLEDEVFISDAERELFKGAMFYLADTIYKLTQRWYDASKTALAAPDLENVKSFGELQVYSVWNQYRLANIIFQYRIQGFGADIPSLVHKFSISDVSWASNNRHFLMLTKDADLANCTISGTIQQVYHLTEGKTYDDPHEFKYIS